MRVWYQFARGVCDPNGIHQCSCRMQSSKLRSRHILPRWHGPPAVSCGHIHECDGCNVRRGLHQLHCRCGGILSCGFPRGCGCCVPARVLLLGWDRLAGGMLMQRRVLVRSEHKRWRYRFHRQLREYLPCWLLLPRVDAGTAVRRGDVQQRRRGIHVRCGVPSMCSWAIWPDSCQWRCRQHRPAP